MAGVDELDPTKWDGERGTGEPGKPIVPKGYAERVAAGEDGNPFKAKPVSQQMADATPEEAAAEAVAAAEKAEAEARRAMEKARKLRTEARDAKTAAEEAAQDHLDENAPSDGAVSEDGTISEAMPDAVEADSTVDSQDSERAE